MSRIACLLDDGFEDSEYSEPAEALTAAGHTVVVIGKVKGARLEGKKAARSARVEVAIDSADPATFDALFIPGGGSPDRLRADPRFVEFTRAFGGGDRPVLAICHGPQLLTAADAIGDRRLTAWKTIQDDLRRMGFDVVDEEVVVDRNLVTSRQPGDIPAFNREALRLLEKVYAERG